MIDKHAQRLRAEQMSHQLAAQGFVAPKLTFPVTNPPKPAEPVVKKSTAAIKYDAAGQLLNIGDTVVTTLDGQVSKLVVGKITHFAPKKVYLEVPVKAGSKEERHGLTKVEVAKFPEQVAKIVL